MSEELHKVTGASKAEMYESLLPQIKSIIEDETDKIANMANITAAIAEMFGFWWTGFYRVDGEELVLSPFQGTLACTRIGYGRGVCGTAWKEQKTVVVEDVDKFPGHIACSSLSRSEIVVPIFKASKVYAVLDIDSKELATFDETDRKYLEKLAEMVSEKI